MKFSHLLLVSVYSVSYTHLDVYKRQVLSFPGRFSHDSSLWHPVLYEALESLHSLLYLSGTHHPEPSPSPHSPFPTVPSSAQSCLIQCSQPIQSRSHQSPAAISYSYFILHINHPPIFCHIHISSPSNLLASSPLNFHVSAL